MRGIDGGERVGHLAVDERKEPRALVDERHAQTDVQKLTDRSIAEIDKILAAKEADLMAV